jgi:glutathionylspermidine synthase
MDTFEPYSRFAARLRATGLLSDPWVDGKPRFRRRPILLGNQDQAGLYEAAEEVVAVLHEMAMICAREPGLVENWFGLTRTQQMMWAASAPAWHGIARADVFMTASGPVVCEVNCDTPSGVAEAVALGTVEAGAANGCRNASAQLGDRFCEMIESAAAPGKCARVVGIVYPTELSEDLSMLALYRRWLERRGWRVVLGSPFNLRATPEGGVALFDSPCDVLFRHYKTDWWGERLPVWRDEGAYSDPEPLAGPLRVVLGAMLRGRVGVVNPFGAVLAQNKRSFAFMWEELERFSVRSRHIIRKFVPRSLRMETLAAETLLAERLHWVLKSDFGCEGDEVVVGAEVDEGLWSAAVHQAVPGRWIAQERFSPCRDDDGAAVNYGVYLIGGKAAGLFCRIQATATDRRAVTAPVLVDSGVGATCPRRHLVQVGSFPEVSLSVGCP